MALKFDEFMSFYDNHKRLQNGLNKFLNGFMQQRGMEALRLTRLRTPVRTGNLRRNWYTKIQGTGKNITLSLINPVSYASYIENGHTTHSNEGDSRYEGWHMAEIAMLNVASRLPKTFELELAKFLKTSTRGS